MKKVLSLVLVLVLAVGMLVACGKPATSETPAVDGETPAVTGPKEVVVNLGSEPPEMNTILTTSTGSMNVLRHVMDGLTKLDENDNPVPAIAESWEVSEDGLTYTFKLRQDAVWTNGEKVTAKDFIFAWNTFFTAETGAEYASTWGALIKGATEYFNGEGKLEDIGYKAIDDYTIEVTLTGPYQYFLSVLAFPSMMPVNEKAYTEIGADKYGTEAEYLVTNGPFVIESWSHESEMVLVKNDNYFAKDEINLDKITMLMISDTNTALNSFLAEECDMIGLTGEQSAKLTSDGKNVMSYDDGSCWYFEYNTTQKGLNNKKVRQALTLAIDATSFVKNIAKNNSTIAYSFTPPAINSGKFTEKVGKLVNRVENDDYTAVKALFEEGLAEEGLTPANFTIAIVTDEGDTAAKNCAFFQEQWNTHIGATVTIEQMTYKARLQRMQEKDFSVVLAGWGPDYNDPMTFMDLWVTDGGNNHTSWSNAEYDKLITAARAEADADKYYATLIEAEKILMDEMPIGVIYNRKRDFVTSDRLTGVIRTAFSDINLRYADVVA